MLHRTVSLTSRLVLLSVALWGFAPRTEASDSEVLLGKAVGEFREGCRVWRVESLEKATRDFAFLARADRRDPRAAYWLAAGWFHLLLYHTSMAEGELADSLFDVLTERADAALETALELDPENPECHAMRVTVLGTIVTRSGLKGIWLGGRITRHRELAIRYGVGNPRAQYLLGAGFLNGPERHGGPARALPILREARRLYAREAESESGGIAPRWGRDHALVFLGRACARLGKRDEALSFYEEALRVNPASKLAKRALGRDGKEGDR